MQNNIFRLITVIISKIINIWQVVLANESYCFYLYFIRRKMINLKYILVDNYIKSVIINFESNYKARAAIQLLLFLIFCKVFME